MNAERKKKEQLVSDLYKKFTDSKSIYFFEYDGLTVEKLTKLRNELKNAGAELKVYKNRIVKIAAEKAGFKDFEAETLIGPNAFVFSNEDEVAAARILGEYAKKFSSKKKELIKFKGGIFEGKVIDIDMMQTLSNIPSRETLLTHLAVGLLQPLQQVAIGLNMLEESHMSVKSEVKEESKVEESKEETKTEEVKTTESTEETKEEVKTKETKEETQTQEDQAEEKPAEEVKEEKAEETKEETQAEEKGE